jgi:hypothetical protein
MPLARRFKPGCTTRPKEIRRMKTRTHFQFRIDRLDDAGGFKSAIIADSPCSSTWPASRNFELARD